MYRNKQFVAALLTFALIIGMLATSQLTVGAYGYNEEGELEEGSTYVDSTGMWEYRIYAKTGEGVEITDYFGADSDMVIPDYIEGCVYENNKVIATAEGAFFDNCFITSVVFPSALKYIGPFSFNNCDNLASITLPDKLITIGEYSFTGLPELKSITIPNGIKTIQTAVFSCCSNLTEVVIPNSVTVIKAEAFSWGPIQSLKMGSDVRFIGDSAFDRGYYARGEFKIYYNGSKEKWENLLTNNKISKGSLKTATMYYLHTIGDVNADAVVTVEDVASLQKHLAEVKKLSDTDLSYADTNKDGTVDVLDVTKMQLYIAGVIQDF